MEEDTYLPSTSATQMHSLNVEVLSRNRGISHDGKGRFVLLIIVVVVTFVAASKVSEKDDGAASCHRCQFPKGNLVKFDRLKRRKTTGDAIVPCR